MFYPLRVGRLTRAMDLVSVIIPTFNRWPMVWDAIDSVREQGYKDYELIVVDDGSNDGTKDWLARNGSGVSLLINQTRCGVAAARNQGVRRSHGRYLCFLDSDDLWRPNKLETQVAFMKANPQLEICQTEEIWIRNGVRVNSKKRHRKPSGNIFRASLDLCLVSPSAVMMTRRLFDKVGGFDESLEVCEDYDLWLRVAVDTLVPLISEPLTIKRGGHEGQLSRSTWGMDRFRIRSLAKLLASGVEGEQREWSLEALRHKVAILAQGARKRGKEDEAVGYEAVLARSAGREGLDGSGN